MSGANLRKKRRLNPGQSVSNLAADMNKKDYVKHLGLSEGSKIVSEVMMEWPDYDPECGSKEEWRVKMLNPNEWGDQIVLHLASNLLELEIQIIPAFRESASDPGTGLTIIEPHITTANIYFPLQ